MAKPNLKYKIEEISEEDWCCLSHRERKVLELRIGINGKQHTLDEIGKLIPNIRYPGKPLNGERVRAIEQNALRKLYHPSRSCKIIYSRQKEWKERNS